MYFYFFIGFLYVCGVCILSMTLLIGLFKKEKDHKLEHGYEVKNVCQSYELLCKIFKLRRIRVLAIILFTAKVRFNIIKLHIFNHKRDLCFIGLNLFIYTY